MSDRDRPRLVYMSDGYTTHDRRFLVSAVEHGWAVYLLRCDGGMRTLDDTHPPNDVMVVEWLGSSERLTDVNLPRFVDAFRETTAKIAPRLVHASPVPTVGLVAVSVDVAPVLVMSLGSDLLIDAQAADVRGRAAAALRGAAGVLVDCQTVASEATRLGADVERITIVPWGVDLRAFAYSPPHTDRVGFRLLSLRSLERVYDVATLLRGFAEASKAAADTELTLTIAGSGSQEHALRQLAESIGISQRVHWEGRVPETNVAKLLQSHDVHVSTALSDGSSLSLLQALAVGRPSIVSDSPSNREWITPEVTGWLFTAGDARSLAEQIHRASAMGANLARIAERGRQIVERRANWMKNRRLIADLYRELAR